MYTQADLDAAIAAERERCAKLCEEIASSAKSPKRLRFLTEAGKQVYEGMWGGAMNCAAAIRRTEVDDA